MSSNTKIYIKLISKIIKNDEIFYTQLIELIIDKLCINPENNKILKSIILNEIEYSSFLNVDIEIKHIYTILNNCNEFIKNYNNKLRLFKKYDLLINKYNIQQNEEYNNIKKILNIDILNVINNYVINENIHDILLLNKYINDKKSKIVIDLNTITTFINSLSYLNKLLNLDNTLQKINNIIKRFNNDNIINYIYNYYKQKSNEIYNLLLEYNTNNKITKYTTEINNTYNNYIIELIEIKNKLKTTLSLYNNINLNSNLNDESYTINIIDETINVKDFIQKYLLNNLTHILITDNINIKLLIDNQVIYTYNNMFDKINLIEEITNL
jgi:hypothetical protein